MWNLLKIEAGTEILKSASQCEGFPVAQISSQELLILDVGGVAQEPDAVEEVGGACDGRVGEVVGWTLWQGLVGVMQGGLLWSALHHHSSPRSPHESRTLRSSVPGAST